METAVDAKITIGVNIDRDLFEYIERRRRGERKSRSAMVNHILADEARRVPVPEEATAAPPAKSKRSPGKSPG